MLRQIILSNLWILIFVCLNFFICTFHTQQKVPDKKSISVLSLLLFCRLSKIFVVTYCLIIFFEFQHCIKANDLFDNILSISFAFASLFFHFIFYVCDNKFYFLRRFVFAIPDYRFSHNSDNFVAFYPIFLFIFFSSFI